MKKQIAMCAACLGMLSFFLYVSFLYVSHDTPKTLNGTVVFSQDIFINGIRMKEDWYSEYEYQVSLYLTTSGKMVIRVVSTEEKDHILQEIPVSLPGDVVEISGFLSSRGEDSGGGAQNGSDTPDVCMDSPDLVISCRDESGERVKKFLYLWDRKTHAFDTEPVEIPADYVSEGIFLPIFSTTRQKGPVTEKNFYQVDKQTKDIVPLRSYALNREEETLEIRDELRQRTLFSGSVLLDEDGNLQNEPYYNCFFGSYSYVTKPWEPDPNIAYEEGIPVYMAERDEYGSIKIGSHTVYYPDRETLLDELGFSGQKPFYQYTDTWGDLETELYFDPDTETGCGFYYSCEFYPEQTQIITGYVFHGIEEQAWKQYPPYLLENRYGETGKEWLEDDEILSFDEDCRYRADGKPEYFCTHGLANFYGNGPEETVFMKINFIYRDDGTLACREYSHNSWMWGTSYSSGTCLYDENERLIYETLYVTHGGETYYYIYEDDSNKPAYALMLDNGGTWGCGLFPVE